MIEKVERPWGYYTVLDRELDFKIKRITVKPTENLSNQMHFHRNEYWVIVSGTAEITLGEHHDKEFLLTKGQTIDIPRGTWHWLRNPGKIPLEVIEVSIGEYIEEDDIVRDDFYDSIKPQPLGEIL